MAEKEGGARVVRDRGRRATLASRARQNDEQPIGLPVVLIIQLV